MKDYSTFINEDRYYQNPYDLDQTASNIFRNTKTASNLGDIAGDMADKKQATLKNIKIPRYTLKQRFISDWMLFIAKILVVGGGIGGALMSFRSLYNVWCQRRNEEDIGMKDDFLDDTAKNWGSAYAKKHAQGQQDFQKFMRHESEESIGDEELNERNMKSFSANSFKTLSKVFKSIKRHLTPKEAADIFEKLYNDKQLKRDIINMMGAEGSPPNEKMFLKVKSKLESKLSRQERVKLLNLGKLLPAQ